MTTDRVFYYNPPRTFSGHTIGSILGRRPVKGDIGLEIEVEGNKFKKQDLPLLWSYHQDNSLRGQDNAEYVLTKPIDFKKVPEAVESLWKMFAEYGSVLDVSNRTSVHVHLNTQKFHLNRLTAFMALYFSVEELLTAWCGEHRIGNLFCLRAKDATAIVSQIKRFIEQEGSYQFPDGMHYAGFNAQALQKFGSIEIRTLRGVTDPQTILDWVDTLRNIYDLSASYPDPRAIPSLLSSEGPSAFLDHVLGNKAFTIRSGIPHSPEQIRDCLFDGIRLAQDLCYCINWDEYTPSDKKADPFGRKGKTTDTAVAVGSPMTFASVLNEYVSMNPQVVNMIPVGGDGPGMTTWATTLYNNSPLIPAPEYTPIPYDPEDDDEDDYEPDIDEDFGFDEEPEEDE